MDNPRVRSAYLGEGDDSDTDQQGEVA